MSYDQMRIIHLLKAEIVHARQEGISRETLPTAREGQLDGYIAGLQRALRLAAEE